MKRQAEQIAKKKPKMDDDLEYEPDSEDERLTNAGVLFPHKLYVPPPLPTNGLCRAQHRSHV